MNLLCCAAVTPRCSAGALVNTKSHQAKLQALAPETAATLERLAEDLARTLQAIQNAEQKVNTQCADAVARYAERKDELRARMEEYNKNADTINALTSDLQSVSEDLAKVKAQMDTRGASMTDTKPLLKVKTALTQLRTETKQLEIRIGVLTSTLTSKKLKEASIPRNSEVSKRGADCEAFLDDDDMEQL
ncbi:hypothetical protein EMIHUDRAFT_201356 [Emiliania huxleyi CCMP1516]|uniref:Uncharacterized protein n=2 Tax=Emiliania huxleyi TaxID=2903 RepID=A0A0D3KHU6_EMIH1|nr:hypothetical protein EMIHUDRAFT_201356 [Emiliania huxleyi CCMP1516]EOD35331.1 hypothetical protein EMIHUDRAFT_201356 [Emiliania huxleyi CCMP1516]|eukprot:XP_005787760.1 hypothetical protein EMIHUDRAFT_201356 [Emiliania huxleyi CCMP1516]